MFKSQYSFRSSVNEDTVTNYFSSFGEILKSLRSTNIQKQKYLSSLNEFSRLCRSKKNEEILQNINDDLNEPISLDDIFKCLKSALFYDAAEVRAAALRAIRYLLKDERAVQSLLRVNLPIFIVRSIDIVLENRTERIQAIRLVRKFLSISPHLFPSAFTRAIIAIAQDGQVEHDILTRACWALLAELSVMSPMASTRDTQNCAFNAIMDAALTGNQPHGMCESLISTLLYMLNWPKYRCLIRGDLDLQIFVAPFTDSHYTAPVHKDPKQRFNQAPKGDVDPYDQRENKFTAAKITLISILRSWQGLIYLCEPQSCECNLVSNSCLKSLINMLYLPYSDVRRRLIDLIFELLYLPVPDTMTDFETGLKYLEKHQLSIDSWKIHDAFVVDEARAILPAARSRPRMDLVNNYIALLLVALFQCNVVDALSEVIITPSNQENSIRATILLYQLLSLSYRYLPTDSFCQYMTLSTLILHATSKVDDSRDLANAALINLGRVHPLKKSTNYTNNKSSLFLGQILEFCSPHPGSSSSPSQSVGQSNNYESHSPQTRNPSTSCAMSTTSTMTNISTATNHTNNSSSSSTSTLVNAPRTLRSGSISSRTSSILSRSTSVSAFTMQVRNLLQFPSTTKQSIKSIIEQDWQLWDWEQINFMLTRPNDAMKKLSSQHYKAFIRRLVHFFKPSSNQYSSIDINNERCKQLYETGCNMVDFLVESPEPRATELLKELLHDISVSMHDPEGTTITNQSQQQPVLPNNTYTLNSNSSNLYNQLASINPNLAAHPDVSILSSSKLIATMSSTYFLFIGRLSNTLRGYQMLESSTIMELVEKLTQSSMVASSPAEVYVRLMISCFDYTKDFNGSRRLLEKFLFHHPEESVRIYATNFLRVLLRVNVPDFSSWAMELLVRQLNSPIRVVQNAAADILDEACDLDENLEGLVSLKQVQDSKSQLRNVVDVLRDSGDPGILLLCRYASSPSGLRYLLETPRQRLSEPLDSVLSHASPTARGSRIQQDCSSQQNGAGANVSEARSNGLITGTSPSSTVSNLDSLIQVESEFDMELQRWQSVFNYRYVKLTEDVLNNTLTYHQKGEDGKYGRRVDRINLMTKNSQLPMHLYGQLAMHPEGIEIMQARKLMEPIYEMIRNSPEDLNHSESSLLRYKAALWALGNVGSSETGYQVLDNSRELVKLIANIAREAPVLSLRGTAFYVLGLLGSTEEGAEEMKAHKWIVQHSNKIALPRDLSQILSKPQDESKSESLSGSNDRLGHICGTHTPPEPKSCVSTAGGYIKSSDSHSNKLDLSSHSNENETSESSPASTSSKSPPLATANELKAPSPQATSGNLSSSRAHIDQEELHPILRENYSINQLEQIRKDILRQVTNLSHSVVSRPAENGLLNLKRKFGLVFQHDLALYSEVCQQLAKYNFRLHARRFLQELFLDIT